MHEEATKHDEVKIPVHLLPWPALLEIAKVLGFGQRKYAAWNWTKGMAHSRLYRAALGHIGAALSGEDLDPESNLLHLAHAGCCILFLLSYKLFGLGTDDRFIFKKGE